MTPIGRTDFRGQCQVFGIKRPDRLGHIYAIGRTGTGKTTLLLNMAVTDLVKGEGVAVIDPHGDLAETLLHYIPYNRISDTVYFDATDAQYPLAFNPLHGCPPSRRDQVASLLVSSFKKIWSDSWGPRLEYILRYALLTLLEYPGATLLDIQPLLTDQVFRAQVLSMVTTTRVRQFWFTEFDRYPVSLRTEAISSILNKTGVFLQSPLRQIVGQPHNDVSLEAVMRERKILVVNLAKGIIGEEASAILGSLLISFLQLAATARAKLEPSRRHPFYLYVDEMHSFVTLSFASILSECRKFGLGVFLTHQYLEQLDERIRAAVFGNVGTLIVFQLGARDAACLAREMAPVFSEKDFLNLPRYAVYLRLLIDGFISKPFSANTLRLPPADTSYKQEILRRRHAANRQTENAPPSVMQTEPATLSAKQPGLFDPEAP